MKSELLRRPPYLRLLFWLKAKLVWRTYTRHTSALVGLLAIGLFLAPVSLLAGFGCYAGFTRLPPPYAAHLLRAVLLAAYVLWLASPIVGYAVMEDYDISKLLPYPLTPRQILTGVVLGSALDAGVLLLLPALLAVIAGFGAHLLPAVLTVLALAAFLCHTIALSHGLGLAAAGILRSRRGRDLLIVLMPLLWIAFYIGSQVLSRRAAHYDWRAFLGGHFWQTMGYLPPGLTARAIGAARSGHYPAACGLVLGLGALALVSLWLAGWLVHLVYTGDRTESAPRRREGAGPRPRAAPRRPGLSRWLPPVVEAVASKEIRYLRRDPAFKFLAMQIIYLVAVIAIGAIYPWQGRHAPVRLPSPALLWGWSSGLVVMESQLVFNIFGVEAGAAPLLFLSPGPRRQILMGKNLVQWAVLCAVNLPVLVVSTAVLKRWDQLAPLAVWAVLATAVFIAAGNLVSVWLPYPLAARAGTVRRRSASRGAGYSLLHLLAISVTSVFALPVLGALLLPALWVDPRWLLVTVPLATAYTAFGYLLTLHLAEQDLTAREVEVIERLRPVD